MENDRRDFLKQSLTALSGIFVVGTVTPIIISCSGSSSPVDTNREPMVVDVSMLTSDLMAIRTTTPPGSPIIIIRRAEDHYTTLLLVCTHEWCSGNNIESRSDRLHCQCHGAEYDFNGNVIKEPAKKPLTAFPTTFNALNKTVTIVW
jgi:Rieske Fe-S protein